MAVMLAAMGVAGCGRGGSAGMGTATEPAATTRAVEKKAELPGEYRVVAGVLSRRMGPQVEELKDRRGIAEMMAGVQSGMMDLRKVKSADEDLNYIAGEGAAALGEMYRRMEQLNSLPRPAAGVDASVAAALHGLAGDLAGFFGVGAQAADRQKALLDELHGYAAAVDRADAAGQLLGKVAVKYAGPVVEGKGRIEVDFDEAGLRGEAEDLCAFTNEGEALADCTVVVALHGEDGALRRNVHFVKEWPAKGKLYALYAPGVLVEGKKVGAETVADVDRVEVTAWSPAATVKEAYAYLGAERDRDVEAWAKGIKLTGRYQPFERALFSANTERGIRLTLAEGPALAKCRVELTFTGGSGARSWFWNVDSWGKGEEKMFTTPAGGLTSDPSQVQVVMSFPRSGYKRTWVFNIKV
jgi:hypothetical protein